MVHTWNPLQSLLKWQELLLELPQPAATQAKMTIKPRTRSEDDDIANLQFGSARREIAVRGSYHNAQSVSAPRTCR
jgi:hypothetical protein